MANISKMKLPNNSTYDLKDSNAGYSLATEAGNETYLQLNNAAGTTISSVHLVDGLKYKIDDNNIDFDLQLTRATNQYGASTPLPGMWNKFTILRDQRITTISGKTMFVPGKRMSISAEGFLTERTYFTQGLSVRTVSMTYSNLNYDATNTSAYYRGSNADLFSKFQNLLTINDYSDFRITGADSSGRTFELALNGASGALFGNISPAGTLTMPVTLTFTPKVFPTIPTNDLMKVFIATILPGYPELINWYLDSVDSTPCVSLIFVNGFNADGSLTPINLTVKTLDSSNNWVNVTLNTLVADNYTTSSNVPGNIRRLAFALGSSPTILQPAQIYVNGNLNDTVICRQFWS